MSFIKGGLYKDNRGVDYIFVKEDESFYTFKYGVVDKKYKKGMYAGVQSGFGANDSIIKSGDVDMKPSVDIEGYEYLENKVYSKNEETYFEVYKNNT